MSPLSSPKQLRVRAQIVSYSRAELIKRELTVHWRNGRGDAFNVASLLPEGSEHVYGAVVPLPPDGERLEYYLTAADGSGRRHAAPIAAPAYTYIVTP